MAIGNEALAVCASEHGRGLAFVGIPAGAQPKDNGAYVLFRVHLVLADRKPNQYKDNSVINHPTLKGKYLIDPTYISVGTRPTWTFFNTQDYKNQRMAVSKVIYKNKSETSYVVEISADLNRRVAESPVLLDYAW